MPERLSARAGIKRPALGSGINVTDPEYMSQTRMLAEAEAMAVREKKKKRAETTAKFTRYAQFAVLFWAIRAGVVAMGFGAGGAAGLMLWVTSLFDGSGREGMQNVPVWTFDNAVQKLPAPKILQRGLPLAVSGVPLAPDHKIFTLLTRYPFSPIQYSTESPVFTYEVTESRGWAAECAAAYDLHHTQEPSPGAPASASATATATRRRVPAETLSSFPFNLKFKSKHKGQDKADVVEYDRESGKILSSGGGAGGAGAAGAALQVRSRGYWYASESIKGGLHSPLMQGISPDMVEFIGSAAASAAQPAHVNLWTGSKGATCASHFDIEDNFFLQLRGTKRFVITEPAAHDIFQPYSSLHPRWRQARNAQVLTSSDVHLAHRSLEAQSRNASLTSKAKAEVPQATQAIPGMKKGAKLPRKVAKVPQTWEITLEAGDLLYLPAYYFHTVTSESDGSTSINAWLPSQAAQIALQINKEVELPFPQEGVSLGEPLLGWDGRALPPLESDSRLKLRLLARTVKDVVRSISAVTDAPKKNRNLAAFKKASAAMQNEEEFRRSLLVRHGVGPQAQAQEQEQEEVCSGAVRRGGGDADEEEKEGRCKSAPKGTDSCGVGKLNLEMADLCTGVDSIGFSSEAVAASERASAELINLLTAIKDLSVRKMLLMDYLDDVFALVAADYAMNTPYGARAFVQSCF